MDDNTTRDQILRRFPPATGAFSPCAHYDPDGDCVEFFVSNEPFKARRLDKWVTVYLGRDSEEVVGSLIKNIRQLVNEFPGLNIEIQAGNVFLAHMLRAPAFKVGDKVIHRLYKRVIEKAESSGLLVELAASYPG